MDKLKKRMQDLPIPPPGEAARQRALQAARAAFAQAKAAERKKIKGFFRGARLIGKPLKGGFAMKKTVYTAAGIAFSLVVIALVAVPNFVSYRKAPPQETDLNSSAPSPEPPPLKTAAEKREPAFAMDAAFPQSAERPALQNERHATEIQLPPPTTEDIGRDRFETFTENPLKQVAKNPVSTFSIDVDTAAYAFVRKMLNQGVLPPKNAVRVEELINYFDYDYPLPEDRSTPFKPTVAVFPTPWNPDTKLLHIGIKGFDIVPARKPRANLVFLIDVSGSMRSPDKLPLLKNAFRMLVDTLEPADTVAIVVYAGAAGTVLDPTPVKDKGRILAALDRLSAGGATAGGEGIRQAYSLAQANFDPDGINRVILATDGDFNVGIRNPEELKGFVERKRRTGVYLSVLGFGRGNYNDALMQKLAQNGNGNAAYIDNLNEARKVLVDEAAATLFPIARDVKIQIEFNPAKVAEYRLIGYESRLLQQEDFNNDFVDAGDIGSGHSVTAIYEITPAGSGKRLIDDLRYGNAAKTGSAHTPGKQDEYAFLKIRYKLPQDGQSRLISTPVTERSRYATIAKVPADIRFAAAVAAFGQILRGTPHVRDFSYDDVIDLALTARGGDAFGYRAEFISLVRLARTARALTQQ